MPGYIQSQVLQRPSAKIISGSAPQSATVGQSITILIQVQNVGGSSGQIFVNLIYGPDIVRSDSAFLQPNAQTTFRLSLPMPNVDSATFLVEVGYSTQMFPQEDIVTDRSDPFIVTRAVFTVDGVPAPPGATDVYVMALIPLPYLPDVSTKVFNVVAPAFLQYAGITLVSVDYVPDKTELLVWVKSSTGGFLNLALAGGLASAIIAALIIIAVIVLGWKAIDLGTNFVQLQQLSTRKDILEDANKAAAAVQGDPTLTPAEKARRINQIYNAAENATKGKQEIPWGLIVGGAIATAGLVGVAAVLSSSSARGFVSERIIQPVREKL